MTVEQLVSYIELNGIFLCVSFGAGVVCQTERVIQEEMKRTFVYRMVSD